MRQTLLTPLPLTPAAAPDPPPLERPHGHAIGTKNPQHIRLAFASIGPLGCKPDQEERVQELNEWCRFSSADIIGFTEPLANWPEYPPFQQPKELFRSDRPVRASAAWNLHHNAGPEVRGGALQLAFDSITAYLGGEGHDPAGLGRWVWQIIRSPEGQVTRIYTAYRPCRTSPEGISTTYQRQRYYWRERSHLVAETDPIKRFDLDLSQEIFHRRLEGERIILMMDANADTVSGPVASLYTNLGLKQSFVCRHQGTPPPATHAAGSACIDCIFVDQSISIAKAGYLPSHSPQGTTEPPSWTWTGPLLQEKTR